MPEPLREQIMVAVAQRLGTIVAGTVTYGSFSVFYYTTPAHTTRTLQWITQYDQPITPPGTTTLLDGGPVLGVVRGSGSTFERQTHVPNADGAIGGFTHEMHLTIWGYVKAAGSDLASTLLERLWADHMNAMLSDPSLGGIGVASPDGPLDTDDGVLEPLAYFAQDWVIKAG